MTKEEILVSLSVIYQGDWKKIYGALREKVPLDAEEVKKIVASNPYKFITIFDEEYPEWLRKIYMPPFVLYYIGDISLIKNIDRSLAVIGTRNPSPFYANKTYETVYNINKDVIIVSGLARGIDGIAHKAALDSGKRTIAILGSGFDNIYPPENLELFERIKQQNLVLSEYPYGVGPDTDHFPMRNRLIAGLSKLTFVSQAALRSGTSITVRCTLEQGKDVLCFPSEDLGNSACNLIIKEGGILVESSEDINQYFE